MRKKILSSFKEGSDALNVIIIRVSIS